VDYIYEQPAVEMLGSLLPRYVKLQIYRALLESAAAEHAARMTAMDAATSNASDVIDKLTLYMNRVRQASITRKLSKSSAAPRRWSRMQGLGSGIIGKVSRWPDRPWTCQFPEGRFP
jgi:hypothetical protein